MSQILSYQNKPTPHKLYIALDNIRSSWNVGAIMRTCDALGAGLILVGYTPRPIGKTKKMVQKTAIGAEEWVAWQGYENFNEVLEYYENSLHFGIEISQKSKLIYKYLESFQPSKESVILWFGNEIHGLNKDLAKQIQELHLPMLGRKESLNVASTVCAVGYLFLNKLINF